MTDDDIYKKEDGSEPFRFNENVARVFPDMLRRSIPGYKASLEAIGSLAARYVRAGTTCYDLGCSLGAVTLAMRHGINQPCCRVVAIDSAPAMIERCRQIIAKDDRLNGPETQVDVLEDDIRNIEISNASMIVLNYTLQFIPPDERDGVLNTIYAGLNPGGVLVLSEKVIDADERIEELLVELHHEHKRRNHYSALEVARKRAALENVLVPETVEAHCERLRRAGFSHSAVWLRHYNFVSIVAFR
jgi:tRNA (cmo5U34)-methyltransferase